MEMNLISVLFLTALVGIATCDSLCMQFKIPECFSALEDRENQNPMCKAYDELATCIGIVAGKCDMQTEPLVKSMQNIYRETCMEGTEMNEMYKSHGKCIYLYASDRTGDCIVEITKEILDLKNRTLIKDRKYRVKVLEIACKYAISGNDCIHEGMHKTCGSEAEEFQRRLSRPSIQLSMKACQDLKKESPSIAFNITEAAQGSETTTPALFSTSTTFQITKWNLTTTKSPNLYVTLNSAHVIASQNLILISTVIFLLKCCLHKWA